MEHFCTLFDSGYLAHGLALHESLVRHAGAFHLWVLCMDRAVEERLAALALPHLTAIPLRAVETADLLEVRPGRTPGEYCWTLTPFLPAIVLDRAPDAERVTYLDADLYFFADPALLLRELDESGGDVLITEHAYAPEYDQSAVSGRFCVQFVTFRRTPAARQVLAWWQARCVEWCFARPEPDRFGDQKYLDRWPALFPSVHVLRQTRRTLAPWNVDAFAARECGAVDPVFFHFHGFAPVGSRLVRIFKQYRIGPAGLALYDRYLAAFAGAVDRARAAGWAGPRRRPLWRVAAQAAREAVLEKAVFRRLRPGRGP